MMMMSPRLMEYGARKGHVREKMEGHGADTTYRIESQPAGGKTSWLFKSVAEELNPGLPRNKSR